ncbi:PREDICTED: histone acetyltransferase HAC2 [Tarenaya hassleriana]|uniref:histone acetyltransferase HAC2 n=1 Tax=Tarenaya hassleriana TaxID=28532 RepID=UPI0008FD337A|nr:PREDICTED: histone acetyltransferase HAC2 [Tarenaya hassleriana]
MLFCFRHRQNIVHLAAAASKNLRGDIEILGAKISKAKLCKRKNDCDTEEKWVMCDKCNGWQHQICGLYNEKMDPEGKAPYICPNCLLEERRSVCTDLKSDMKFEAKDLPCTNLSNYIEHRLFRSLGQEREETAKATGKSIDEVPGPEDLVVRVVLSVDKDLKVNKQYADIFHDEEYPTEFPYRSKAILLFQKIEGVDVCIYGFYVQEYGSECRQPNQRCVYISYLDSVKYFRPERVTTTGESLRTFVYHQILLAYLKYIKNRGFATCYLWASPPIKGEDYILYCHPGNQKTPKADKLRQWYHSMLKKSAKEGVILNVTNLYERYFVLTEQSACKITASRLPYFDGAYWSSTAEKFIQQIEKGGKDELKKKIKLVTHRRLRAFGHHIPPKNAAKDIIVMQKLDEIMLPVKEEFMVVQLHYSCAHCSQALISGWRWFCKTCKNVQLCERCHDAEQKISGEDTHIANGKEKHFLSKVMMNDIPSTTEDTDIILESDVFEDRNGFLELCQKNNYQFDTLRRAKYSSMMILYHLHSQNEQMISQQNGSAKVICTLCNGDITTELHHPCLICSKYKVCMRCYSERITKSAIHLLAENPSAHGRRAEDADPKLASVTETLNALRHAVQCQATNGTCSFPKCITVKELFRHGSKCEVRAKGGCQPCIKVCLILGLHASHCEEPSNCRVPFCGDMKESGNIQTQ